MSDIKHDDMKAKVSLEELPRDSDRDTNEGVGKDVDVVKGLPPPGSQERIAAEKRLVRKLDMRVLPTIFVIYIMNYIDVCANLFSKCL